MALNHRSGTTSDYRDIQTEVSLGIVKPHAYAHRKQVEQMIEGHEYVVQELPGTHRLYIAARKDPFTITQSLARLHYEAHQDKPFYEELVRMMCSGPSELMVVEGPDAIHQLSVLTGPTDPKQAPKGTIRERFGEKGENIMYNAFHRSADRRDAGREIRLYFEMEELPPGIRALLGELW